MSGTSIKEELRNKIKASRKGIRNLRKPLTEDVFESRTHIGPNDLHVENYLRHTPKSAFNPGALLDGDELMIFPRLIFDYYGYVSSVGFLKLRVDDLLQKRTGKPIPTKVILWPKLIWEFRGCEDPRVQRLNNELYMLYTGFGYRYVDDKREVSIVQGLATLEKDKKVERSGFFRIEKEGKSFVPYMKDSAFIKTSGKKANMLLRPTIDDVDVCWRGVAEMHDLTIPEEGMVPVLGPEDWELKVGWSTNTLRISSNEYLVGWHSISKEDLSYRNGLAVVDEEGNLLSISNYLLAPKGVTEEYGDRALTMFGCGLVRYREKLIWVGGICDYAIGTFTADLDRALEKLKSVEG